MRWVDRTQINIAATYIATATILRFGTWLNVKGITFKGARAYPAPKVH